jgi:hypothetical protein
MYGYKNIRMPIKIFIIKLVYISNVHMLAYFIVIPSLPWKHTKALTLITGH